MSSINVTYKMTSIKVLLPVLLLLFQFVQGNVPVVLWESSKSDRVNAFSAFHSLSTDDFLQYCLQKVRGGQPLPLIALFSEELLSMEDFSWQDSQGQGHFPRMNQIYENAPNAEFLPSVQDPIHAVNRLTNYEYSLIPVDPNGINGLPDGCGKIFVVKLPEAYPGEDRADLLRRHDVNIAEAYGQLSSKCSHVIGVLTGQQPSWVESEEEARLKRSLGLEENNNTVTVSTYTLYQDDIGISMLYSNTVPSLIIDGSIITLQNTTISVGGDNSKRNKIKLIVKYQTQSDDYLLTFNFDNITIGYWYLRSVDLTIGSENKNYEMKCGHDIYAPLGKSYHCGYPVAFRNITKEGNKELVKEMIFSDIQVEPFFFKIGSKSFSVAMDQVPFFTPAIWSGLFVIFLLSLVFSWGVCMIMDIRTMDRFDDPKGKTITIPTSD